MTDDIVERLRRAAVGLPQDDMNQTAADEIERLRKRLQACQSNDDSPLTDDCITQNERFLLAENERLEAARKQLLDAARGYMDMVVEERDSNERLRGEIECLHGKMRRLRLNHLTTLSELQDAAAETARLQAERAAERALADQLAEALRVVASQVKRPLEEDPGTWSVIVHALKTYKEIRNEH
jgi:hypothetical protein